MPQAISCVLDRLLVFTAFRFLGPLLLITIAMPLTVQAQSHDVCVTEYNRVQSEYEPQGEWRQWGGLHPWEESLLRMDKNQLQRWEARFAPCQYYSKYKGAGLHFSKLHLAYVKQAIGLKTDPRLTYKDYPDNERRALILQAEEKYREAYPLWKEITDTPPSNWDAEDRYTADREFEHFLAFRLKDDTRLAAHRSHMVRRHATSRFDSEFHLNHGYVLSRIGQHAEAQIAYRKAAEKYWTENPEKVGTATFPRGADGYYQSRALQNGVAEPCPGSEAYPGAYVLAQNLEQLNACLNVEYLPLNELPELLREAAIRFSEAGNMGRSHDMIEWFWRLEPEPPFVNQFQLNTLRFTDSKTGHVIDDLFGFYILVSSQSLGAAPVEQNLNRALSVFRAFWETLVRDGYAQPRPWEAVRYSLLMDAMRLLLERNMRVQARSLVQSLTLNQDLTEAERASWKIENARMLAQDGDMDRALSHLVALDDELRLRNLDRQRRDANWLKASILVQQVRHPEAFAVLDEMFPPEWVNQQIDETSMRMLRTRAELAAKQGESTRLNRYVDELETFYKRNNASCEFCPQLRAQSAASD